MVMCETPLCCSAFWVEDHREAPYLTEAVRERCSRESITQPTWHSMGGLELCRVFLFLGVWTRERGGGGGFRHG